MPTQCDFNSHVFPLPENIVLMLCYAMTSCSYIDVHPFTSKKQLTNPKMANQNLLLESIIILFIFFRLPCLSWSCPEYQKQALLHYITDGGKQRKKIKLSTNFCIVTLKILMSYIYTTTTKITESSLEF